MAGRAPMERLSLAEVEVLVLLMNGYETKQAARKLFITYDTAKRRVATAARKLGASSRTQTVALALVTGQLDGGSVEVTAEARRSAADSLRASTRKR